MRVIIHYFDKIVVCVIISVKFEEVGNMLSENAKSRWIKDFENGVSLSFAPDSVKDNKALVMVAVRLNGMNLKFVSERLQNDVDVVEAAINQNVLALQFANSNLQKQIIHYGILEIRKIKNENYDYLQQMTREEFNNAIIDELENLGSLLKFMTKENLSEQKGKQKTK